MGGLVAEALLGGQSDPLHDIPVARTSLVLPNGSQIATIYVPHRAAGTPLIYTVYNVA